MSDNNPTQAPLLDIQDLQVNFHTRRGLVRAVRNLNLSINEGETLALVGESGCGKSVTAHAITRLVPMPPGDIASGSILFRGDNLLDLSEREMRTLRGSKISMIFQEPMTSLNPVFTIGTQIAEVFRTHTNMGKKEAFEKAVELLDLVKIPAPAKRAQSYPHQLSGGMRQRAMIAMALASPEPGLMIADEPTTALDVTIQAQILQLLSELKERVGMSILLITHDMGVVAETADRVAVMYAGRKVEDAPVEELFANPQHPYAAGLLGCQPSSPQNKGAHRLESIDGSVPDLLSIGEECPFSNRCPNASDRCRAGFPEKSEAGPNHAYWCHHPISNSGVAS
ncbi:MAG: ABC transporter ATP-binding protein [Spirochaetales bacterium]|nr:ABC transporter ATP-binding protein [Spirochaetales bacterium]